MISDMNFLFISPNFPKLYSHFVKSLCQRGVNVFGIGDEPYQNLNDELKENLKEYCQVTDLGNLKWMKNTVSYLTWKYGRIDFIESNNEWWLSGDAFLREYIGLDTGFWPKDMDKIKYKSQMKAYFQKAGVKTARFIIAGSLEKSLAFAKEVSYPLFAKPDCGVGAMETYRINNEEELKAFHRSPRPEPYIIEEYIQGYITSFDGICDLNGNVVIAFQETFPKPIAEILHEASDLYYYATTKMDQSFYEMGQRVVKSFGISKRCFHIEFWHLTKDRPGLGEKGETIALECNMRSPGGDTPDLLSIALDNSYYDVYADVITQNKTSVTLPKTPWIAVSVAKRNRFQYEHNDEEVKARFTAEIARHGNYPAHIADAMGDEYYFARFDSLSKAMEFQAFVHAKKTSVNKDF